MSNATDALQQGQDVANQTFDRTMSGLKDGIAQATTGFEQAQSSMHQGVDKAMKTAQDMMAFSQGNIEAMTRSSQILATGLQDMFQHAASSAKALLEDAVGTMKAMASVNSIREAIDLQSGLLRSATEKAVSQASQLTDASMKLSERTVAPITARLSLATEMFTHAA